MSSMTTGKIPPTMTMFETKFNCQPHYKYNSAGGDYISVIVGLGITVTNVDNKSWVLKKVTNSISTIFEAANLRSVEPLLFSCDMMFRRKVKTASIGLMCMWS